MAKANARFSDSFPAGFRFRSEVFTCDWNAEQGEGAGGAECSKAWGPWLSARGAAAASHPALGWAQGARLWGQSRLVPQEPSLARGCSSRPSHLSIVTCFPVLNPFCLKIDPTDPLTRLSAAFDGKCTDKGPGLVHHRVQGQHLAE